MTAELRAPVHLGRVALAHWQTWRPYTTCYPAMLGLAGVLVAGGDRPGQIAVAVAAPVLGWISGHYLGDHVDRHLDAIAKPQRPIPSGRLSPRLALVAGIACALASLLVAVWQNWHTVPVFVLAMTGVVAYSAVFKRRGLSGNLCRGVLSALALVVGAMAAAPWPPLALLPVALGFLLHDTASNLIGTVRDVDGDRAGGCRSVPVRHGVAVAVRLASALWLAGTALVGAGALVAHRPGDQLLLVAVALVMGVAALRVVRPEGLTARRALRSHELFVAERLVLTAAVVAGVAGAGTALLVLAPVLAFSLVLQNRMRSRHEFPDESTKQGERA
ncbi:4-hydroxybenzoate polyprenyltransferase/geranylgeranylglycerol-phosphate geranylgeranyltransferase [Lentzea fradiae]|uniref:4-hydroxybenzoate polyprenyltransferase/geranylgeranylglycerol-phosphate geranylgeranyltransferase n=1 Tax=Lentzea fradiae TaxID=200378 RepID=A0A1G7K5E2_9PSEU|nr:UbiA family prenyltransferase [Lentzea fradiae]SDF32558.1 4-hydroxybenzoate polyprenyltransferase/geranylgeranylglycerol-phosphate geranylgeranyltransferase [Lentzea fradiae]